MVGFLCNWCSYASADKACVAQLPCPANVQVNKSDVQRPGGSSIPRYHAVAHVDPMPLVIR